MTKLRMHINPRSETGTDDFDIWGLSKVHIDDNQNIYVSGGDQVWCYWADFTFRTHFLLEAGEVMLIKVFGNRMVIFNDFFHIFIYEIESGELVKHRNIIPDEHVERFQDRKIEA